MTDDPLLIVLLELVAIIVVPMSAYATAMAWVFARRYWRYGARLPLVMALVNTIAFPVSVLFGVVAYRALADLPRLEGTGELVALAVLILDVIPLLTTGYLIWLDRVSRRDGGPHPGDL
jgi:hypothetical protein